MDRNRYPAILLVDDPESRNELELLLSARSEVALSAEIEPGSLVIVEVGSNIQEDMRKLLQLIHSGLVAEIFLTSRVPDKDTLVQAMRMGIKEFLHMPVSETEFGEALERFKRRMRASQTGESAHNGRTVAVIGAREGIGATTLAVSMALNLGMERRAPVALLDMRHPYGDIPLFLDMEYQYGWLDILRDPSRLDETYLKSIMIKHQSGLDVLPASGGAISDAGGSPQALERLLLLLRETHGFIVLDANPYFDPLSLTILEHSDVILLVCTQSIPCLASAKKILEAVRGYSERYEQKMRIVAGMHIPNSDIDAAQIADILGKQVYASLPFDYPAALSSVNIGSPLAVHAPKSHLARAAVRMSARLARELQPAERKRKVKAGNSWLLGRLFRKPAPAEA